MRRTDDEITQGGNHGPWLSITTKRRVRGEGLASFVCIARVSISHRPLHKNELRPTKQELYAPSCSRYRFLFKTTGPFCHHPGEKSATVNMRNTQIW